MSNPITTAQVNQMEEFSMIGGTQQTLIFTFVNSAGTALDITTSSFAWRLSPLGYPNNQIINLTSSANPTLFSVTSPNILTVTLSGSYTSSLRGKYVQQPVLIDYLGNEYIWQQGLITIIPKIQ